MKTFARVAGGVIVLFGIGAPALAETVLPLVENAPPK